MAPLKNNRHEKFALAVFKGMSQKDAAIHAGFKPDNCDAVASRLVKNCQVSARIWELKSKSATDAVMSVGERKERLSEIARARLSDFIEVKKDGSISKVDLQSGHNAALQEVSVTEFRGVKGQRSRDRSTKVKLHNPVQSIAELNKMDGEYPPSNVLKVELEPGKNLQKDIHELLSRLRGYGNQDKE